MKKENIYISTIASDAAKAAREYGLNLEIAEFCTAWNMDEKFANVDGEVQKKLDGISRSVLHAPFNELFPCAIDKKARALAAERYRQAIGLAKRYGSAKVVIHGGYNPRIYYPVWYTEQSVIFWKEFLKEDPGVEIVLENVLETDLQWLPAIVKDTDHERLKLCLDIGHVNAYSEIPVMDWLESWAPYLSHFHIHNNDTSGDTHSPLTEGSIPMKELLEKASRLCPDATFTLELTEAEASVRWMADVGLI
ncbi:MAG: sugar phosphate isomerase/epimerase [Oscillospiraceae bacterium]|nr:sugar phosphate isomerase/epimerase [Oscillospiraceae bacterium]